MDANQRIEQLEAEVRKLKRMLNRMRKGDNVSDYPFTSWDYYGAALIGSLTSGYDNRQDFPAYTEETDERSDLSIIQEMLNEGFSAQRGLDVFIDAVARGTRYGYELFVHGVGHDILKEFLKRGATSPELYPIFKVSVFPQEDTTPEELKYMFEDEVSGYGTRSVLLDALSEVWTLDVSDRADWASLDATYWEDILDTEGLLTRETYERCIHMALKYTSKYLQSLS